MNYCKEQEDAIPCTKCGFCEDMYYADTEQEYEMEE